MRILSVITVAAFALASPAGAADRLPASATKQIQLSIEVVDLVQAFMKAQHDFDQAALRALTADSYAEISPIGELDPRDKMLGFYDPAKKIDGPAMTLSDTTVRAVGRDGAVLVTTISYQLPTKDGLRTVSLRAGFVAQRIGGAWKLVSAQYTPIRAKS